MPLVTTLPRATLRAPRALALFAAPARAAFPRARVATAPLRARGLATAPPPLIFYVKRMDAAAAFTSVEVPTDADVATLVKATITELRLDVSPADVMLALEEGGPPLDARRALSAAFDARALALRPSLLVTLRAVDVDAARRARVAALPLPPPLVFAREDVGGATMMVATCACAEGGDVARPLFLTSRELAGIERFLDEGPSDRPQMLMLTGAVKSGKTRLLRDVIPGLLSARAAAALPRARRPAVLPYVFELGSDADVAAAALVQRLGAFAHEAGLELHLPPAAGALGELPYVAEALARRIAERGGTLWLLLDELQAPLVASPPALASRFIVQLKMLVELCAPFARIVGTGSGMVTLLTALRAAAVNGFAIWDAISHVRVGREPDSRAALAMATRILESYGTRWPAAVAANVTPALVVGLLATQGAFAPLTSARPALVAFLAATMGDALAGAPEAVFEKATRAVLAKLERESARDAASALVHARPALRRFLRALASGQATQLERDALAASLEGRLALDFAELLCEEDAQPARLLPPYGALMQTMLTRGGELAVSVESDRLDLPHSTRLNLVFFNEVAHSMMARTRALVSRDVMASLASNGVGLPDRAGRVRAPVSIAELRRSPAPAGLLAAIDAQAILDHGKSGSRSASQLANFERGQYAPDAPSVNLGLLVLGWLRHAESHVHFPMPNVLRAGMTAATVQEAATAAADALVAAQAADFGRGEDNVLFRRPGGKS